MKSFEYLSDVLEFIKIHRTIYYQAPLNHEPVLVRIKRYTIDNEKPERSKLTFHTKENGTVTINIQEHLERFRDYRTAGALPNEG